MGNIPFYRVLTQIHPAFVEFEKKTSIFGHPSGDPGADESGGERREGRCTTSTWQITIGAAGCGTPGGG